MAENRRTGSDQAPTYCGECRHAVPDHRDDCPIAGVVDAAVRVLRTEMLKMTFIPYRSAPKASDTGQTLPCIRCNKRLSSAVPHPDINQPSDGLAFSSPGHYGSAVWDPMDGTRVELNLCDPCLEGAIKGGMTRTLPTDQPRSSDATRVIPDSLSDNRNPDYQRGYLQGYTNAEAALASRAAEDRASAGCLTCLGRGWAGTPPAPCPACATEQAAAWQHPSEATRVPPGPCGRELFGMPGGYNACKLRAGHAGDHEDGETSWREPRRDRSGEDQHDTFTQADLDNERNKYFEKARVYGAIACRFRQALEQIAGGIGVTASHVAAREAIAWRSSGIGNGVPKADLDAFEETLQRRERAIPCDSVTPKSSSSASSSAPSSAQASPGSSSDLPNASLAPKGPWLIRRQPDDSIGCHFLCAIGDTPYWSQEHSAIRFPVHGDAHCTAGYLNEPAFVVEATHRDIRPENPEAAPADSSSKTDEDELPAAALEVAIALAEEGWAYASEYFRDKWSFQERVAKLRRIAAVTDDEPLPTQWAELVFETAAMLARGAAPSSGKDGG